MKRLCLCSYYRSGTSGWGSMTPQRARPQPSDSCQNASMGRVPCNEVQVDWPSAVTAAGARFALLTSPHIVLQSGALLAVLGSSCRLLQLCGRYSCLPQNRLSAGGIPSPHHEQLHAGCSCAVRLSLLPLPLRLASPPCAARAPTALRVTCLLLARAPPELVAGLAAPLR
jgi:hypothetical protein